MTPTQTACTITIFQGKSHFSIKFDPPLKMGTWKTVGKQQNVHQLYCNPKIQVSHEKKTAWLGYIEDEILSSYIWGLK